MPEYKSLESLADFEVFRSEYEKAVKTTASSYQFSENISEAWLPLAYNRFIKLFVPLTEHDYSEDKIVTLAVAIAIHASSAFPLVKFKPLRIKDIVGTYGSALAFKYPSEVAALSFGVHIFSVESSRILRAQGLHSSNYAELEFLDAQTMQQAIQIIREIRSAPNGKIDYTRKFRSLIRVLRKFLDAKIAGGRIIQS